MAKNQSPEAKERRRKSLAAYYAAHKEERRIYNARPDVTAKDAARRKAYYQANKEKWKQKARDPEVSRARSRKYYAAHREARLAYHRAHYETNKQELNDYQKRHHAANPDKRRFRYFRTRYGVTGDMYAAMWVKQDGKCAICQVAFQPDKMKNCHIDHDHVTKKVRGLLCHDCNLGVGRFKDDIDRLKAAIKYLRKAKR